MTAKAKEYARLKSWRKEFKKRLHKAVKTVWGSTTAAIAKEVAPQALYRWIDPKRTELPRADDLWRLCEAGSVSAEYLLFDRGDMLVLRDPSLVLLDGIGPGWNREEDAKFDLLMRGYFHLIAIDQLRRRAGDLDLIQQADKPGETDDLTSLHNELLERVVLEPHAASIEKAIRAWLDSHIDAQMAALYRTSQEP